MTLSHILVDIVALDSVQAFNHMALAPFGLATYKLDAKVWASPNSGDQEHISSLRCGTVMAEGAQHPPPRLQLLFPKILLQMNNMNKTDQQVHNH